MILDSCLSDQVLQPHIYLQPHPHLRHAIAHYTYMQDHLFTQQQALMLIPDVAGCIVIMGSNKELMCNFWGGTTTVVKVHADAAHIQFRFFVEFLPSGAHAFFPHDQNVYINEKLELTCIQQSLFQELKQAYETSRTVLQFAKCLDTIFLQRLHSSKSCVSYILNEIHQQKSIMQIETDIGYTRRHLQRIFQTEVGCTMKQYQNIQRINRAIQLIQKGNLTQKEIAQICGFYDEAHFIHEFYKIVEITPYQYRKQMSDFYNETLKF